MYSATEMTISNMAQIFLLLQRYAPLVPYRCSSLFCFQGERGFDDMDDHITDNILRDRKHSVPAMQSTAASAYHFLMRESPEPGTAEAYRMFLATVEVMFKTGAAIELCRLGYKFELIQP